MSCYHPFAGVRIGYHESGKPKYNIVSLTDRCLDDFPREDVIQIPCGKCLGCRLDYAHDWQGRLLMELMCHDSAWFVTMTYNDDSVPKLVLEDDSGSLVALDNLCKKDVQNFIKRLRDHFPDDHIRYYITGEYGETTFRSHYHGIIFGLHLRDVEPIIGVKSINNEQKYRSDEFEKIWSLGTCELGTVTPESTSYVARYVTKKLKDGDKEELYTKGLEKEFALMSRKPAIGRLFFDMHPDMFKYGCYDMSTSKSAVKIFPSRYFKNLFDTLDTKSNRYVKGKKIRESKLLLTDLNYLDLLDSEENDKISKTKILTRDSI